MHHVSSGQDLFSKFCYRRALSILLLLALVTGFSVSVFTVIEEMCLATACSDAASFVFFGVSLGWFGIVYFILVLLLLWLRNKAGIIDWAFSGMIFSGIGAEFRLIWIQKYIIGSWCPLCVSICFALFIAATLLVLENIHDSGVEPRRGAGLIGRFSFAAVMTAIGLAIALGGVKALV